MRTSEGPASVTLVRLTPPDKPHTHPALARIVVIGLLAFAIWGMWVLRGERGASLQSLLVVGIAAAFVIGVEAANRRYRRARELIAANAGKERPDAVETLLAPLWRTPASLPTNASIVRKLRDIRDKYPATAWIVSVGVPIDVDRRRAALEPVEIGPRTVTIVAFRRSLLFAVTAWGVLVCVRTTMGPGVALLPFAAVAFVASVAAALFGIRFVFRRFTGSDTIFLSPGRVQLFRAVRDGSK